MGPPYNQVRDQLKLKLKVFHPQTAQALFALWTRCRFPSADADKTFFSTTLSTILSTNVSTALPKAVSTTVSPSLSTNVFSKCKMKIHLFPFRLQNRPNRYGIGENLALHRIEDFDLKAEFVSGLEVAEKCELDVQRTKCTCT